LTSDSCILRIKVIPGASHTKVMGWFLNAEGENILKIAVTAAPEKGKANKVLIAFLSKSLKIKQSDIYIEKGETSSHKKLKINCSLEYLLTFFKEKNYEPS
jgi:uncharacterized protein